MISAFGIEHIGKAAYGETRPLNRSAFNAGAVELRGGTSSQAGAMKAANAANAGRVVRQTRPIQGNNLRGAGFRQATRAHSRTVLAGKLARHL